jgi:hypothetical protein
MNVFFPHPLTTDYNSLLHLISGADPGPGLPGAQPKNPFNSSFVQTKITDENINLALPDVL